MVKLKGLGSKRYLVFANTSSLFKTIIFIKKRYQKIQFNLKNDLLPIKQKPNLINDLLKSNMNPAVSQEPLLFNIKLFFRRSRFWELYGFTAKKNT
jgi:hypothetical protein